MGPVLSSAIPPPRCPSQPLGGGVVVHTDGWTDIPPCVPLRRERRGDERPSVYPWRRGAGRASERAVTVNEIPMFQAQLIGSERLGASWKDASPLSAETVAKALHGQRFPLLD